MPSSAAWVMSSTPWAWNHSAQSCRSASCSSFRREQVGGLLRLAPHRGEEAGTAHRDHGDRGDAVAAQPRIAAKSMADRQVDAVGDKIGQPAGRCDVQFDVRVARGKPAEPRHQPGCGERRWRAYRQHAGPRQRLHPARRLADLAEGVADRHEIGLSGFGQCERAVGATEQCRAKPLLQAAHQLADRARRNGQFGGGLLHAEVAGGCLEGAQGVQGRQAGHGSG